MSSRVSSLANGAAQVEKRAPGSTVSRAREIEQSSLGKRPRSGRNKSRLWIASRLALDPTNSSARNFERVGGASHIDFVGMIFHRELHQAHGPARVPVSQRNASFARGPLPLLHSREMSAARHHFANDFVSPQRGKTNCRPRTLSIKFLSSLSRGGVERDFHLIQRRGAVLKTRENAGKKNITLHHFRGTPRIGDESLIDARDDMLAPASCRRSQHARTPSLLRFLESLTSCILRVPKRSSIVRVNDIPRSSKHRVVVKSHDLANIVAMLSGIVESSAIHSEHNFSLRQSDHDNGARRALRAARFRAQAGGQSQDHHRRRCSLVVHLDFVRDCTNSS